MNQILSVEDTKKSRIRQSQPIEIKRIIKTFSIIMIIFAIALIGSGSYSIYKKADEVKGQEKPIIVVTQTTSSEITIKVTHDKELAKVTYKWNDGEEINIEINPNTKNQISQIIKIPVGNNNKLSIYAQDINGNIERNESMYSATAETGIYIEFTADGPELTVNIESEKELSYMTYRWDEDEEEEIELSGNEAEQKIEIPKGRHTITVAVVDIENNTQTAEQQTKLVTKPKIEVSYDESEENYIIKATDEEAVKRIEFMPVEGEESKKEIDKELPVEERKEYECTYPIHAGSDNKLVIRVYNESDVYTDERVMFRK